MLQHFRRRKILRGTTSFYYIHCNLSAHPVMSPLITEGIRFHLLMLCIFS